MGKKGDLSDFEHGVVVGARRAGLSISETADFLGFSHATIIKISSSLGSSLGENAFSMPEVRGEWPGWFEMIERQQ